MASAPAAPVWPVAPVLILLQAILSVVLTGDVIGTNSSPCCGPAPPSVAFAEMDSVMGISLSAAAPLEIDMPAGAPVISPTAGITLLVP